VHPDTQIIYTKRNIAAGFSPAGTQPGQIGVAEWVKANINILSRQQVPDGYDDTGGWTHSSHSTRTLEYSSPPPYEE